LKLVWAIFSTVMNVMSVATVVAVIAYEVSALYRRMRR